MSNAFTNFLSGAVNGLINGSGANMKDYQHADRLYVRNNYARAPKFGFLYFVKFNINKIAIAGNPSASSWINRGGNDVGLLVKRADLPKYSIATETLNQYNRKTVVQKQLTYGNINLEFHDDNSDLTTNLWKSYYQYYYTDSVYGTTSNNRSKANQYGDTKYGTTDYAYGLDNLQTVPFFDSIDIYVMHQHKFTQYTLINPMVVSWDHDTVNQDESSKVLANKMTLAYESVEYNFGKIKKNEASGYFAETYYDKEPSPIRMSNSSLFGAGGIVAGADSIFGEDGSLANAKSPLDLLGVALQAKDLVKNVSKVSLSAVVNEGYSIANGVLGNIAAGGQAGLNQPGGITSAIQGGLQQNGFGVNLFSNSSVDGTTVAKQRNITGKGQ